MKHADHESCVRIFLKNKINFLKISLHCNHKINTNAFCRKRTLLSTMYHPTAITNFPNHLAPFPIVTTFAFHANATHPLPHRLRWSSVYSTAISRLFTL